MVLLASGRANVGNCAGDLGGEGGAEGRDDELPLGSGQHVIFDYIDAVVPKSALQELVGGVKVEEEEDDVQHLTGEEFGKIPLIVM